MAALQRGVADLADRTAALPFSRTWTPVWCRWASETGSLVVGRVEDSITDLKITQIDGRLTAVTCTLSRREVQFWDLEDARLTRTVSTSDLVHDLALGEIGGALVLVTGSLRGEVCVFDLKTMALRGGPWHGHQQSVTALAVATVDGRPRVLSTALDGTIWMWDPEGDDQPSEPLLRHRGPLDTVVVGERRGRPVVLCGGEYAFVRLLELDSGRPPTEVVLPDADSAEVPDLPWSEQRPEPERVSSLVLGTLDGEPIAVSGSSGRTIRAWALSSARPIANLLCRYESAVNAVALGEIDGTPVVLSGHDDGAVRACDLRTGESVGDPLIGHHGRVFRVAQVVLGGRSVIVSAGYDGTVRIWHPRRETDSSGPATAASSRSWVSSDQQRVTAVAVAGYDAERTAFYGESGRPLKAVEASTGELIGEVAVESGCETPVATGIIGGQPVLAAGDVYPAAWDLTTGKVLGEAQGHTNLVLDVAVGELDGTPVLVTGSMDGYVRAWDLRSAAPLGEEPMSGRAGMDHRPAVGGVRLATVAGRSVVVALSRFGEGTLLMWAPRDKRFNRLTLTEQATTLDVGVVRGRSVAATGGFGSLRLWNLPALQPWVSRCPGTP